MKLNRCAAAGAAATLLFAAGIAIAAEEPVETIVVTGTKFNTDAAPAKASLDTVEPQTIINRSYIENFLPPTADYVTVLSIAASMTGSDPNGPGLSDGGAKNTLRGLGDGMFVMQYDGIPFGDTNGPTHHNISYFPASTIGSAVVDRGPGNAGNIGAATYGGTIKLFSETLTEDAHGSVWLSGGSFNTTEEVLNVQSGDLNLGTSTTRVLVNLQNLSSDGALSGQDLRTNNELVKIENRPYEDWTLTLFADYSFLKEHLDDNNGLTPAQIAVYGKNFALQNTNPNLPTYYAYNYTTKETELEYLREDGTIAKFLKLDNTTYSYSYWNHTFSPNSQTQTLAQINAGTSGDNTTVTLLNGTKIPNQLLAYDKQNAYRVIGDVLRTGVDYDLGWVKGEVRAGIWWEQQSTHRFKYYFDANLCNAGDINPFNGAGGELASEIAAAAECGVVKGPRNGPLGYAKDDEYSSWRQYEPFMEIDIKPLDALTITPGIKYVHWDHAADAPVAQGSNCGVAIACPPFNTLGTDFHEAFTTNHTLPFATINYRLSPSWSVYAEYAQGIYVPDITAFETNPPTVAFPKPETTTNYQLGTVYYADNFTLDADVYYIGVNNNYVSQPCSYDINETCFINNGRAIYKGIEGEGTYAFDQLFGQDLRGLSLFLNGSVMSSKAQGGLWEPNAPKWIVSAGLLYQHDGWRLSVIDKTVGPQFEDAQNQRFYKLGSYSDVSLTVGYDWDRYSLSLSADNVLDSRSPILITEAGGVQSNPATSLDQYFFQSPASVIFTFKVRF